jgi:hypothetical protein
MLCLVIGSAANFPHNRSIRYFVLILPIRRALS